MALTRYRLGDLIRLREERNAALQYGVDDVRGVNNLKKLINTKASLDGRDLSKFQIVEPGTFFFNHRTSRNGSKISITYNYERSPIIVTEDYVLFDCIDTDVIDPTWLYVYMSRAEFDRYAIMNSWGSSTEFFNWEDMRDVEIDLPPIEVQRKYVVIYEAMCENQRCYEAGLEDLKLACDLAIEEIKKQGESWVSLQEVFEEVDSRNADLQCSDAKGINKDKTFMSSAAKSGDLKNYKLVEKGNFAFSGMQTGRDECIRIALNKANETIAISPAYTVLKLKDTRFSHDYIMMWFERAESDRLGWFLSDSSIRSNLDMGRFYEIKIPAPASKVQESLGILHEELARRKEINEKLKQQIRDLCPILIKGSLEEAGKA